ncbi:DUF1800 family protein [uncultured Psychrobacter sp.]|uniref:DUF1800 family protein n=1 Tax=uncultured Psychrobacter sp. TaxID=259303 RepID=UPI00345B379F
MTLFLIGCGGSGSADDSSIAAPSIGAGNSNAGGINTRSTNTQSTNTGGSNTGSANTGSSNNGGSNTASSGNTGSNTTDSNVDNIMDKKALNDVEAARFLQQAQFSSTKDEINYLKRVGIDQWLNRQFSLKSGIGGYDWLYQQGYNTREYRYSDRPVDWMAWQQLLSAKDTLRKRMALALSEILVLSTLELGLPHRAFAIGAYWDLLNKHAFGNFRDLLKDITINLGMGAYLDLRHSRKADSRGRRPDENYAREVMQLFTIGLVELNLDGTPKLRNGKTIETYTQETVSNIAMALTGWTVDGRSYVIGSNTDTEFARAPMINIASRHDTRSATFFDTTVPAGSSGEQALEIVVDTLFNHPNVAPFICKQLIQRLVTSNPSPEYIRRVATVFNSDEKGRRGNLQSVLTAILTNDEARNPPIRRDPTIGKVREPIMRLIQWVYTFSNRQSVTGKWFISKTDNRASYLNQSPFRSPSVFNYFDINYAPITKAFTDSGIVAPELQLHNETATVGYINHIKRVIEKGVFQNFIETLTEIEPDYSQEMKLYEQPEKLVDHLNLILCAGQMSPKTKSLIHTAVTDITQRTSRDWKQDRIHLAVFMTMVSPDYLVQK